MELEEIPCYETQRFVICSQKAAVNPVLKQFSP